MPDHWLFSRTFEDKSRPKTLSLLFLICHTKNALLTVQETEKEMLAGPRILCAALHSKAPLANYCKLEDILFKSDTRIIEKDTCRP